jgi:hypothetical protein
MIGSEAMKQAMSKMTRPKIKQYRSIDELLGWSVTDGEAVRDRKFYQIEAIGVNGSYRIIGGPECLRGPLAEFKGYTIEYCQPAADEWQLIQSGVMRLGEAISIAQRHDDRRG